MTLEVTDIMEILPHRYPMLLVDRQVGGVALLYPEENRGLIPFFTGIDKLRFRHPVIPGDQLVMRADIEKIKGRMGKVKAQCHVGDTLCAEGEYLFALMPGQNTKK